jgi:hypothetical protein
VIFSATSRRFPRAALSVLLRQDRVAAMGCRVTAVISLSWVMSFPFTDPFGNDRPDRECQRSQSMQFGDNQTVQVQIDIGE